VIPRHQFIEGLGRRKQIDRARPFREGAFSGSIKAAYDDACAFTGLKIVNGGGRSEVRGGSYPPRHGVGARLAAQRPRLLRRYAPRNDAEPSTGCSTVASSRSPSRSRHCERSEAIHFVGQRRWHGLLRLRLAMTPAAKGKVPDQVMGLLKPDRRLLAPSRPQAPHPIFLRWRRENVFKG